MRCGECGTSNEANQRFCIECGHKLVSACPTCGTENPPAAKFCGECGSRLTDATGVAPARATDPSSGGPTAERRLVSVLFADLVGFTPFSEERDPEEVRETLTAYFELSREVIERYGGTVEKFIGDAVMAVWGTPVAHEDDAERAVRAAVELIDAVNGMGGGLDARVGVETGEAAVTLGATDQGMVAGDRVNTAARIQSVAEPGMVLVGDSTKRSASSAIVFEPAGEHELKGKSSPVPLWRALRVVAERGGRGRSDGLEAPFVGRDTEFRLLKELFHASSREHRVRMISIIGQGGIGKSRLAWEMEKYLDGLVEPVWWHHGRSPSYGSGIAFWALGEMVRGRCGLVEKDDEATTRARVAETVAKFVPEGDERDRIEAALLTLLGVGGAAAASEELFPAWRSFFEHVAQQGTTLMVFEDLQWADPGLLAFIDHLTSWSRDLPICIVVLTRPELIEGQADWDAGHRATSIPLSPLERDSMQALLDGLVPGLPATARDHIVDRADGIPLYAVETVRMLVNDGRLVLEDGAYRPAGDLAALKAPESLRALVASRLDSLTPQDRALLQDAAVIGHTFSTEALTAVSGLPEAELETRLRALVRREMVTLRVDPRSPERGQHSFSQELLREVAYETLARDDRRKRHLATARYFESLDAHELAGALAAQYQAAHRNARPGEEADALAIQARLSLKGAAERAMALGSTAQAQQLYEAALELVDDPAEEADLLVAAAQAAVHAGHADVGRRHLERAIELFRDMGRRVDMARATAALVDAVLMDEWQPEAARAVAREAVDAFADLGEGQALAEILGQLARLEMLVQEDFSVAVAAADRALAMAERLDLAPLVADLLITRGTALSSSGRALEGLGGIEAGRRLASSEGLILVEARALLNVSGPMLERDPRAGVEASRTALALARRVGDMTGVSMAANNLGESARYTGDWDIAAAELRHEIELVSDLDLQRCRASLALLIVNRGEDTSELEAQVLAYHDERVTAGDPVWQRERDGFMGSMALPAGRYAESARRTAAAAEGDPFNAALLYADVALAALLGGDAVTAAQALAGMEATGSHGTVVKLEKRRTRAGIDALEGRVDASLNAFEAVLDEYRQMDLPFLAGTTALLVAALLDPSQPRVKAAADEARETFERLGAGAWLERLDEVLDRPSEPARATEFVRDAVS